jgi:hypothetical protein
MKLLSYKERSGQSKAGSVKNGIGEDGKRKTSQILFLFFS